MKGGVENFSPRDPRAQTSATVAIVRIRKNQRIPIFGSVVHFFDLAGTNLLEQFLRFLTLEFRVARFDDHQETVV